MCRTWDFLMTIIIIYGQVVGPVILVFPDIYMNQDLETGLWVAETDSQQILVSIEMGIDILYCFEICFNFFKRTRVNKTFSSIALNYI